MKLSCFATLTSAFVVCASLAQAAPITGEELGAPVTWAANSTNALNHAQQTPGRVGQVAPFVIFVSNDIGEVTLSFSNGAAGLAFFEIRIDGIDTGATNHPNPLLSGLDTIHTGGVAVSSGVLNFERTFLASDMVEVRLALGGERDWDFNWTAFYVDVPEPASMAILGLGLVGMVATRRRRSHA